MSDELYLGMRPGDLDGKPYEKYWNPNMAPLDVDHIAAPALGPVSAKLDFPVTEVAQLLEPGYLPLENGYTTIRWNSPTSPAYSPTSTPTVTKPPTGVHA